MPHVLTYLYNKENVPPEASKTVKTHFQTRINLKFHFDIYDDYRVLIGYLAKKINKFF